MHIARKSAPWLCGLAFLATLCPGISHAQQYPTGVRGAWITSYAEDDVCKANGGDQLTNEGLLRIDAREALFYESSCSVKRARPAETGDGTPVELTLSCGGEGETWNTREIWSVTQVGARKALIMTRLESSAPVAAGSKKQTPMRRQVGAQLYLACE
jgi:hypothetical protein